MVAGARSFVIRIGAGAFRGRSLVGPARGERGLRPTSGRAKQVLFDVLGPLSGVTHVLDLFAGAGTLGFEAMSRGVERATFVDRDARAVSMIERNATGLGVANRVRVVRMDVIRFLGDTPDVWPLVLADPPYESASWAVLFDRLQDRVPADGRLVIEHATSDPPAGSGFECTTRREVGGTTWSVFRPGGTKRSEEG